MSALPNCKLCQKTVEDDQDSTTLICHAAGQTVQHTSVVHDKCWERFKKQFVRGRAGGRSATVFFCPVDGCHNALEHTHTHARKVEKKPERRSATVSAEGAGGDDGGEAVRRIRRVDEDEDLEEEDDNRCREFKADGTRCGRNIFDQELGVCKLHVEVAKRKIKCAGREWRGLRARQRRLAASAASPPAPPGPPRRLVTCGAPRSMLALAAAARMSCAPCKHPPAVASRSAVSLCRSQAHARDDGESRASRGEEERGKARQR